MLKDLSKAAREGGHKAIAGALDGLAGSLQRGWGAGVAEAWKNPMENATAHLARGVGGAAVGALTGMGINLAGKAASLPENVFGGYSPLQNNQRSLLGSAVTGAAAGFGVGVSAFNSNGILRSGYHKALGAASMVAPKTMNRAADKLISIGANGPAQAAVSMKIGSSMASGKTIAQRGKQIYNQFRHEGPASSRVGGGLIAGGLGFSAFSANSLNLAVPSNYGYRG